MKGNKPVLNQHPSAIGIYKQLYYHVDLVGFVTSKNDLTLLPYNVSPSGNSGHSSYRCVSFTICQENWTNICIKIEVYIQLYQGNIIFQSSAIIVWVSYNLCNISILTRDQIFSLGNSCSNCYFIGI